MEFKFNDAKSARPGHLERCLCYDKYLKGYRCYVYDDISKYWCTQATTEHDPNGENHIVDYADFQVTEWASLSNENKPSLPSDLDEAAFAYENAQWEAGIKDCGYCPQDVYDAFKAGAEWMAGQGYTKEETVYFERLCDENRIMVDLGWGEPERGGFNPGDKVIVQIRKKQ